jgi:DNA mismatch repair protein MSH4
MTSYSAHSTTRSHLMTNSSSYQYDGEETTNSRTRTGRSRAGGSATTRPRTAASTIAGAEHQQLVCAINESRGTAPTVGLALVNLITSEAVLCQICDSQTYVRTVQKLCVYGPSEILMANSQTTSKSKLLPIIEECAEELGSKVIGVDRGYFAEDAGHDWIRNLAFPEDLEAIKISVEGNFFAVCCIAAVCFKTSEMIGVITFALAQLIAHRIWQAMKYIEVVLGKTFAFRSLRIRYEPSEGSMMIDVSTTRSLELIQNLQNPKSKDCLFGLLNETLTPMGSRYLRSNILQPLTDRDTLELRYDALEELTTKEEMFFATRQGWYYDDHTGAMSNEEQP